MHLSNLHPLFRASRPTFGHFRTGLTAAFVLLLSTAGAASGAVGPQSLTLSAPQLAGSPGDTLNVGIQLSSVIGVSDLAVIKFAVRVDTLTLRSIDAVRGAGLASWPAGDFDFLIDGDRLSISAVTATPQSVGAVPVPITAGDFVRMRFVVRDDALDARISPLDITATNDEQSIVMLSDPSAALPGIKTVDVDGSVAVTNGFTCARGDASGDGALGTDDAILTLRFAAGLISGPTAQILCGADANLDREYNSFDAAWILSGVVGLPLAKTAPSGTPVVQLQRHDGDLWLSIEDATSVRAAELRVDTSEGARWLSPRGPDGALLVSDAVDGQLRVALAATRSLGSKVEFRLPVEGARDASLVHLRLYGADGTELAFEVETAVVQWSKTPRNAVASLALGSYPNPFNPSTTLQLDLPRSGRATLEIFDAAGRRVVMLLDEELAAGTRSVEWRGLDQRGGRVASGVYFARLISAGQQARQRLLLVK
jgi:hypothetical protein